MILPDLTETCGDGIDNNCNGLTDEGCLCNPGETQGCGFAVGQCRTGEQSCTASGQWGACAGEIKPIKETCDGIDNNCNGLTDEGIIDATGTCSAREYGSINTLNASNVDLAESGFILFRSLSDDIDSYENIGMLPDNMFTFVDRGLLPNTRYYYAIVFYNGTAVSNVSYINLITSPQGGVVVNNVGGGTPAGGGANGNAGGGTPAGGGNADNRAGQQQAKPVISNVHVIPDTNSVEITWDTDINSDSKISLMGGTGLPGAYDSDLVSRGHSLQVSGLSANTLHRYTIKSCANPTDWNTCTISNIASFVTTSAIRG
jgi:hypothetical protein